jgi:hypothetical protein
MTPSPPLSASPTDASVDALPPDALAALANGEVQRQAARLVQESFNAAFRMSLDQGEAAQQEGARRLAMHLNEWAAMATRDESWLRRALLLAGLDQWGLGFVQAFGTAGLKGLSLLLGHLRDSLEIEDEAAVQQYFSRIQTEETNAQTFKIELRRELHLTLWHAMIACDSADEAQPIAQALGSMMAALIQTMPTFGWRIVADALASIQIRCLTHGLASSGLAQDSTQQLFAAVFAGLDEAQRTRIMNTSSQAVLAWQQAQRSTRH